MLQSCAHLGLEGLLDEDLSEGEGCAAGGAGQQAALHGICLAVGDVVVPAVAGRASHDEQGARRQQHCLRLSSLPKLHHS